MMNEVVRKIATLGPEMAILVGACVSLFLGLWSSAWIRRLTACVAGVSLVVAGGLAIRDMTCAGGGSVSGGGVDMVGFIKLSVVGMGLLLLLVCSRLPDSLPQIREVDGEGVAKKKFEPALVFRGEFFAFFLMSLAGVMLTAGADDLVWLFLALELTSLPTYLMVAVSKPQSAAQESAVKYFFLGALAVAIFLYGFTFIYGATGFTNFSAIRAYVGALPEKDGLPALLMLGLILSLVGLAFKIAAVPMHFYTADVYQGAASGVSAFLAFVPKTAGFVAMILLLNLVDPWNTGRLPETLSWLLGILAVLTMTVGNVLGLLQQSAKRILAYSSVAHSGYMLVGLAAGVSLERGPGSSIGHGIAAVLFYLLAYGMATIAAFAVLACLKTEKGEADDLSDLSGLSKNHPALAAVLLLALLSLIGLPPMIGFLGKIYLFGSAVKQGMLVLVIIAVLNSAVSAVYYLRIAAACYFGAPNNSTVVATESIFARRLGACVAVCGAVVLGIVGGPLVDAARAAGDRVSKPVAGMPAKAEAAMKRDVAQILPAALDAKEHATMTGHR